MSYEKGNSIVIEKIFVRAESGALIFDAQYDMIMLALEHRCEVIMTFNDKEFYTNYKEIISTVRAL